MGVITATSKKHDKIKWSESIDTGLSLPTPAVLHCSQTYIIE